MHTFYLSTLAVSVVGETGIASELIKTGGDIGNLSAACILGIVSLTSIVGLVKVYMRNQQQSDEMIKTLKETIDKNTETLTTIRDNCTRRLN